MKRLSINAHGVLDESGAGDLCYYDEHVMAVAELEEQVWNLTERLRVAHLFIAREMGE
jgi:hypothetical protein